MKPPKSNWFTYLYKWGSALALRIYFGKVEIVGRENVPLNKPFILATNHQNAFLDPHVAGAFCPKVQLYYLTRGDIFNKKTTPLLRLLNMIPIYRIRDGIGSLGKNEATFEMCAQVFRKNNAVLIFSEANHGEHYYLRPIKKGTARLALDSQEKIEEDLQIVPCGINYFSHLVPRRKVTVAYGKPISVGEFLRTGEDSEAIRLKKLSVVISEGMKDCLIIPEKSEDYEAKAQEVFAKKNESMRFSELREFAARDFSDRDIETERRKSGLRRILLLLFSIPNFGPLLLLQKLLSGIKDKVFWSSFKYALMIFSTPIWWTILVVVPGLLGYWNVGGLLVLLSAISFFIRAELRKA